MDVHLFLVQVAPVFLPALHFGACVALSSSIAYPDILTHQDIMHLPSFFEIHGSDGNCCSQTMKMMRSVPKLQQTSRAGLHLLPHILSATMLTMRPLRKGSAKRLPLQLVIWRLAAQTAKAKARARARLVRYLLRMMTHRRARLRERRKKTISRRKKGRRSELVAVIECSVVSVTGCCGSAVYTFLL